MSPVYHALPARPSTYSCWLRASPRLTCTRRRPSSRFPAAFFLAASLTCTRLLTAAAPAALHIPRAPPPRRPPSRPPASFFLAASLTCTRLLTAAAPAVLHIRVAVPLCCTTSVLPSMVATPPCTRTVNLSALILDLANLARMAASSCASLSFGLTGPCFAVLATAGR